MLDKITSNIVNNIKTIYKEYAVQFLVYTVGFLILAWIIKNSLDQNGLTAIYNGDALVQHYASQQYLANFFYDIIHLKTSVFSEINYKLALGQDILTTYHYYGLNDPISVLTGLRKIYNHQKLYAFLLFFRMYLAGIGFILMANRFKKNKAVSIVGAYIYVFCGYCLTVGFMHPYFINPMILLPLLIASIDILIRDGKTLAFVISVFSTIVINFYFAYMILVVGFIYAVTSLVFVKKDLGSKETMRAFKRGIGGFLLGLLLSAYVIVPLILGYVDSYRFIGKKESINLFIGLEQVRDFLLHISSVPDLESDAYLGISGLVILGIYSAIASKKKKIISLLVIAGLFVVCPKLQSMMNGFSYPTYRWVFAIDLLLAYIFVDQYDNILKMSDKKRLGAMVFILAYIFIVYKSVGSDQLGIRGSIGPLVGAGIFIVLSWLKKFKYRNIAMISVAFLLMTTNVVIYTDYISSGKHLIEKEYVDRIDNNYNIKMLSNITSSGMERVETGAHRDANFSDIFSYPSVSGYYSIQNYNYSSFNRYYENSKASPINSVTGMDSRSLVDGLLSVKYHYGTDNVPLEFNNTDISGVYQNHNYIPFGFTYDKYVFKDELDTMNPIERQSFLLGACLLEEKIDGIKRLVKVNDYLDKRNIVKVENGPYRLEREQDQSLNIGTRINIPNEGELYAIIKNLSIFCKNNRFTSLVSSLGQDSIQKVNTTFITDKSSKWYTGEKGLTVNLGHLKKGDYNLSYRLLADCNIDSKNIDYILVDTGKIKDDFTQPSREHLVDLNIKGDKITGQINCDKDRLLFISIPYSKGFDIKVNGTSAKVYRANIGFMAVKLPSGNNFVSIDYHRPGQSLAYVISLLALIFLIGFEFTKRKIFSSNIDNI